jgi:hypothetical protein
MRQGYVGRAPRTVESQRIFSTLYQMQKEGQPFRPSAIQLTPQLSGALIGVSGTGKTTAVRRLLARYPQVIFHPKIGHYQIPHLIIEAPYDGASVKGIAEAIFRRVDELLPDAGCCELYSNPRSGADVLMTHAARVLHMHSVGLLVVDEIQNLENSPKTRQALMTLLVSASNTLHVPILFSGTNKAHDLLSLDFRQARRSVGIGSTIWKPLARGRDGAPSEWDDFLTLMWRFQWTASPVPLTPFLSDLLFHYSQGVVDIAIKLFAVAQARAVDDGTEAVTGELIESVAKCELVNVEPMIAAIRNDDLNALGRFKDIAPAGLDAMMADVAIRSSGRLIRGAAIPGSSPQFAPAVAEVLTAAGFDLDQSQALAEKAAGSANVLDGVKTALKIATSGGKAVRKKDAASNQPEFGPGDYRNALNADVPGDTVLSRLKALKMVADVDAILSA